MSGGLCLGFRFAEQAPVFSARRAPRTGLGWDPIVRRGGVAQLLRIVGVTLWLPKGGRGMLELCFWTWVLARSRCTSRSRGPGSRDQGTLGAGGMQEAEPWPSTNKVAWAALAAPAAPPAPRRSA